jgi:hypothetical protein
MNKNRLKSIWSVLAGFLVVAVFSTVTDSILEAVHVFPPIGYGVLSTPLLLLALSYRMVFTILGGYVTATLAPKNPMKHVIILGIFGTIAGIGGIFAGWNLSAHWYPIAIAVTGFPCVYLGGKLKTK